jgi:Flp pilus assembly protein TadG
VDIGDYIGVTRQHDVLLEYVAQETHTSAFVDLGAAEKRVVRDDAEERHVSYAFLRQSGNQHGNLKVDLQNDVTTGDNRYPKNRQQILHLLDKYSNTYVAKVTQSEGTSFCTNDPKRRLTRRKEW